MLLFQTHFDLPPLNCRCMRRHHSTLPLLHSSVSWWGFQHLQRFHTLRWWRRIWFKLPDEILKLPFISFSVIRGSSLIRRFTFAMFCSNSHRLATMITVSKRHSAELKFLAPFVNCKSWWRMIPKSVWQTLKALMEWLPLTVLIIHHCMKISPWRCFCADSKVLTLTKHFAVQNKFGQ